MKHAKWIAVFMLAVLPTIAVAQLRSTDRIVAQVPYTFVVANTVVPLGECVIQRADPASELLAIRSVAAGINIVATASTTEGKTAPAGQYSLVFHKYGSRYFLAGLKVQGSTMVYWFTPSQFERELLDHNVQGKEEIRLASAR